MAGSEPLQEPESVTPMPAPGPEVWPPGGWVSAGGWGGEGQETQECSLFMVLICCEQSMLT